MKEQVNVLNATPHKRFVLSIIADYDLKRSMCELIDNAIDIWIKGGRNNKLIIDIDIDLIQKSISVLDNAGGVKESELEFLISPGASTNSMDDDTIGIFGVGIKRAVIALSQQIKISTRYKNTKAFSIEYGEDWLQDDDWNIPYYETNGISKSSTLIELSKLRIDVTQGDVEDLSQELSAVYTRFLKTHDVEITVNSALLRPFEIDNWAYPPTYEPRRFAGVINITNNRKVNIEVTAGLTKESSPSAGEYGVYFYCNDRLVVGALKSPEVGFMKNIVGLPHPSLSIMRVVVSLKGSAKDMPWNSSKSNLYYAHPTYTQIREWLFDIIRNIAQLSRRLEGTWPETVFKYADGEIQNITVPEFIPKKSYLLDLPPGKTRYVDRINQKNSSVESKKQWTVGLVDGMILVEYITKQKLKTKNRSALILLDSNLEIAFKEYLVNDAKGKHYSDGELTRIFQKRHLVIEEMKQYLTDIDEDDWKKVRHYYDLRCKLVHERATVLITDDQIKDQRKIVEKFLRKLFRLKF